MAPIMGNKCIAASCGQSKRQNNKLKHFHFPTDKIKLDLWLSVCKVVTTNYKNIRICERH